MHLRIMSKLKHYGNRPDHSEHNAAETPENHVLEKLGCRNHVP